VEPSIEKTNIKQDLKDLIHNKPWLVLFFAAIFNLTSIAIRGAVTMHYMKYYVGAENEAIFFGLDKTSLFFTLGPIGLITGVFLTKYVSGRFDRRSLMLWLGTINAVLLGAFYFIPPEEFLLMLAIHVLSTLVIGPCVAIIWAMYGDAADYGEWKFGRRATGLVFSATIFAMKFGLTIGATLSGWLLSFFGFVANVDQTEESLNGIRLLFCIFPMAFAFLKVFMIYLYPLRDAKMVEIHKDLEARKESKS
jgi:GPH family glycoside/pentoside/hexuronide:cation symporter